MRSAVVPSRRLGEQSAAMAVGGGDKAPGYVVAEKRDACGMSAHHERGRGSANWRASSARRRRCPGLYPQKDLGNLVHHSVRDKLCTPTAFYCVTLARAAMRGHVFLAGHAAITRRPPEHSPTPELSHSTTVVCPAALPPQQPVCHVPPCQETHVYRPRR
jgi:hypothetical protein